MVVPQLTMTNRLTILKYKIGEWFIARPEILKIEAHNTKKFAIEQYKFDRTKTIARATSHTTTVYRMYSNYLFCDSNFGPGR